MTDNAKYFTAKKFQDFCTRENIDLRHGVARYPEVQGLAEKNVGTVKTMLSKFIAEDTNWPSKIPDFTISYNTSTHSATGFSPFYHVFGRHYLSTTLGTIPIPTFPPLETMNETAEQFRSRMRDLWRASFQANLTFNMKTLEQANLRRTPFQLEVGMKVLRRVSPEKVQAGIIRSIYDDGPYQITRIFGPTSFEAVHLLTGEISKSNIHQCKKYHLRSEIPRLQLLRQRNLSASFSSHLHNFLEHFPSTVYTNPSGNVTFSPFATCDLSPPSVSSQFNAIIASKPISIPSRELVNCPAHVVASSRVCNLHPPSAISSHDPPATMFLPPVSSSNSCRTAPKHQLSVFKLSHHPSRGLQRLQDVQTEKNQKFLHRRIMPSARSRQT